MREDFNKLLTERERIGHKAKFHDIRNAKGNKNLDPDMSGGKESIHRQRRSSVKVNKKSFNENLNPLKNFLRVNVGRPWDKIYSDICSAFDKRKVVNNHILEHLFQYVEREVYIIDGKPHTMNKFRYSRGPEYSEITAGNPRYPSYYVDPRDGLMKLPKQGKSKRILEAEGRPAREKKLAALYHRIDDDNHLLFKDGIWWVYTAKDRPPQIEERYTPYISYSKQAAYYALPPEEREARKLTRMIDAPLPDKIDTPGVPGFRDPQYWGHGPTIIPKTKYFFRRQTASHKQLKAAGVAGTAAANDEQVMSHREASKYRPKKAGK